MGGAHYSGEYVYLLATAKSVTWRTDENLTIEVLADNLARFLAPTVINAEKISIYAAPTGQPDQERLVEVVVQDPQSTTNVLAKKLDELKDAIASMQQSQGDALGNIAAINQSLLTQIKDAVTNFSTENAAALADLEAAMAALGSNSLDNKELLRILRDIRDGISYPVVTPFNCDANNVLRLYTFFLENIGSREKCLNAVFDLSIHGIYCADTDLNDANGNYLARYSSYLACRDYIAFSPRIPRPSSYSCNGSSLYYGSTWLRSIGTTAKCEVAKGEANRYYGFYCDDRFRYSAFETPRVTFATVEECRASLESVFDN